MTIPAWGEKERAKATATARAKAKQRQRQEQRQEQEQEQEQEQRRNTGISPLRRQSAPPSVEMTFVMGLKGNKQLQEQRQRQVHSASLGDHEALSEHPSNYSSHCLGDYTVDDVRYHLAGFFALCLILGVVRKSGEGQGSLMRE